MSPLAVITTGTGYFTAGQSALIVAGGERIVYLGPTGHEVRTTIAEFTLLFPSGMRREFCQYGRDFVFAPADTSNPPPCKPPESSP